MPHEYEAIRDSLIKQGKSEDEAKTIAAKIYNSRHPENPVHRNYDTENNNKKTEK